MKARIALVGILVGLLVGWLGTTPLALADDGCVVDPVEGTIDCSIGGSTPGSPGPSVGGTTLLRYVYTAFDPAIGDCHFWSPVPGGLDAWNPANDGAIIAITTRLPVCPVTVMTPTARAWQIYRSWYLATPQLSVTPDTIGITGLPTHVSAPVPRAITHTETMPNGQVLRVRARVLTVTIEWGDGTITRHDPGRATGYPDGLAFHAYTLKTCSDAYRATHVSGGLCHPFLDHYVIDATYTWVASYSIGRGWIPLDAADRSSFIPYEVAEARGVNLP